ncbi:tRNA (adenosine(37)-N6)-threonylcarbamoyltransferase complex ATPase subunit type 1 TsaE [Acidithiobacillus sp.]|jgi:tRNA threonylcarbamoyladenosine biosynthesis protein TsaE|uniref:tRNA (adenosine(37)-N6)-threonylcarbamoyltransferase complex ATPase subunit type 1 TsaE n=1 Tax=Acidithiobacillus sp. TaxID=1872118 RepID=UPI0025C3F6CF|nr:tRNA (adenosine(37)-N6)-threonylcarbamoyltransferase complex ATPase subunit type 1 TsaE [Acidithiobacillus sp.]MCK9187674.1 tRNA (adenosine(37)-N6)-threonylcarbamoyltransferase complex ATPase subunit type 1 TsaE [Acidithiobacillus sp.]MCK9358564.1 tRNA (adenosine(37)-N6)-threonylcarbamoyltransferase complex ATPase subunit type 1 TsaE [Acidithiobacillus sp.]
MHWDFADTEACRDWGRQFAQSIHVPLVIYLEGDLGVGKTTLAQAILKALGVTENIKSPTYTLMESYPTRIGPALHLDLYRLQEPEELEFIGIRDYLTEPALWLVEWPERGAGFLPAADLSLTLRILDNGSHRLEWPGYPPHVQDWTSSMTPASTRKICHGE